MKILSGVHVIDLGSYISAPYAAMLLGELGADVVKVERPESTDPSRNHKVNGNSPVFFAFNRNKRGLALDFTVPDGQAVLQKILSNSDVMIINVRPGVEKKLGLDADSLRVINPRLITCNITGFGATGPYAKRPAYDNVGMAMSGLLSRFHQGEDPKVYGPAISDSVTGMHACMGILAALFEREKTGVGRHVEVNLMESMISLAIEPLTDYLLSGHDQPFYYRGGMSQAYILTCKDGLRIGVHISNQNKFWNALTEAIDRKDLAVKYAEPTIRIQQYEEISKELAKIFVSRNRSDWLPLLEANDVPFGPERSLNEIETDPQIIHLKTFQEVDPELFGSSRIPNRPIRFDGDNQSNFRSAPKVGADTEAILHELGFDIKTISKLRDKSIIN
ncbi:MAG: CaiB/BaiF CoA-transferase family protein [Betaproteobacteria bacterium]